MKTRDRNLEAKGNVVLVDFYREIDHVNSRPLLPLACLYLASYLDKNGYNVIIQQCGGLGDIDRLVENACEHDPILVGISATFGVYTDEYVAYSKKLKAMRRNIPVLWGGIHAGSIPELCMQKEYIDFVVMGEGEIAILQLLEAIEGQREFRNVRNLVFKARNEPVKNNCMPVTEKDVDQFPLNFDLVDNYSNYVEEVGNGVVFHVLQTSRGCPFNCTFCYNSQFNNRRWRQHSIDRVVSDVLAIRGKIEFDKIRFVDDLFFTHEKRARKIISILYKEHGISIYGPDARLANLNDDLIPFLIEHDCKTVFVGTESENDRVLSVMDKKLTNTKMVESFNTIKKYPELKVGTGFILGIPSHTREEIRNSIKFALKWQAEVPNLDIGLETYLPFPGTEMYEEAVENGYPPPDDVEYYVNCYSSSKFGKFKGFSKMEWLHVDEPLKTSLEYLNWVSAFYSTLIVPPTARFKLVKKIINFPFRAITLLRINMLYTRHYKVDQYIYKTIFNSLKAIAIMLNLRKPENEKV